MASLCHRWAHTRASASSTCRRSSNDETHIEYRLGCADGAGVEYGFTAALGLRTGIFKANSKRLTSCFLGNAIRLHAGLPETPHRMTAKVDWPTPADLDAKNGHPDPESNRGIHGQTTYLPQAYPASRAFPQRGSLRKQPDAGAAAQATWSNSLFLTALGKAASLFNPDC